MAGVKIFSQTAGALFGTVQGIVMMLSIAFSFFYVTFFHEYKNEKLHLFNSHKLVSRPRPRTFKTKTETLDIKTKTLGLKTKTL